MVNKQCSNSRYSHRFSGYLFPGHIDTHIELRELTQGRGGNFYQHGSKGQLAACLFGLFSLFLIVILDAGQFCLVKLEHMGNATP